MNSSAYDINVGFWVGMQAKASVDARLWPQVIEMGEWLLRNSKSPQQFLAYMDIVIRLADAYRQCHEFNPDPAMLDRAEELLAGFVVPAAACIGDAPFEMAAQFTLGSVYLARYEFSGDAANVALADRYFGAAAGAAPVRSPLWSMINHNRGNLFALRYGATGAESDFDNALRCYENALTTRQEAPASPEYGRTTASLGSLYEHRYRATRNIADARESETYYLSALSAFGTNFPMLAAVAHANLGNVLAARYQIEGRREDALAADGHYDGALESVSVVDHPEHCASVRLNQGMLWQSLFHAYPDRRDTAFRHARTNLQAALAFYQLDTAPLVWAIAQQGLGRLHIYRHEKYAADGDAAAARGHIRQALRVSRRKRNLSQWAVLHQDGGILALACYRLHRRPADAVRASRHFSLLLAVPALLVGMTAGAAAECMKLRLLTADWEGVVAVYGRIAPALESLVQMQLFLESDEDWLRIAQGLPSMAAYACARLGRLPEAASILEQGLARRFTAAFEHDRITLETVVRREHPAEYGRLIDAGRRLGEAAASRPLPGTPIQSVQRQIESGDLRVEFERAVEQVRGLPDCAHLFQGVGDVDVMASTTANKALVYFVTTAAGTAALIFSGGAVHGPAELVRADRLDVETIEALLIERKDGDIVGGYLAGQLFDDAEAKLHESFRLALDNLLPLLGKALLSQVAERLRRRGIERAVLIPGGHLKAVPLHAATFQDGGRTTCLLDEFDVAYVPSVRALQRAEMLDGVRPDGPFLLGGIGNPEPSDSPLPFARAELRDIAALFPHAECRYGRDATKAAAIDLAASATHLHFACHGVFDPDKPLRSHIVLAGEVMTLAEVEAIAPLDKTRLVVLSACRTAMSQQGRLPDEFTGLAAGFLEAGASSVVATMWPVDDFPTALLMREFYRRQLQGDRPESLAGALRLSQGWLRTATADAVCSILSDWMNGVHDADSYVALSEEYRYFYGQPKDACPFSNPYYWAAFMLAGV